MLQCCGQWCDEFLENSFLLFRRFSDYETIHMEHVLNTVSRQQSAKMLIQQTMTNMVMNEYSI